MKYFVRHFLNLLLIKNLFAISMLLTQEILQNKEELSAGKDTEQRAFNLIATLLF